MLVLSRKALQSVVIGQDIKLTIVRVEGNQVRIGIEAPGGVRILRGELMIEPEDEVSNLDSLFQLSPTGS